MNTNEYILDEVYRDPIPRFLRKIKRWDTKEALTNLAIILILLTIYGGF